MIHNAVFDLRAHPRSRGENSPYCRTAVARGGSSPLTRGKRRSLRWPCTAMRLIPAHAGKTGARRASPRRTRAHPRSRGENGYSWSTSSTSSGSSPLTRGKRDRREAEGQAQRLIPAHAGKTPCRGEQRHERGAHPRSRGENWPDAVAAGIVHGSSPLTRGKPRRSKRRSWRSRLIPAHAGKTHANAGTT